MLAPQPPRQLDALTTLPSATLTPVSENTWISARFMPSDLEMRTEEAETLVGQAAGGREGEADGDREGETDGGTEDEAEGGREGEADGGREGDTDKEGEGGRHHTRTLSTSSLLENELSPLLRTRNCSVYCPLPASV